MIKVNKEYLNPPAILVSPNSILKIEKAVTQKDGARYTGYHYGHEEVTKKLNELYHKKCSYCESKSEHVATLQVEHYRPKKKVEGEINHSGYYWLGLEWSNLLLGCPKCNGRGAKGSLFPILGQRVFEINPFDGNRDFRRDLLLADHPDMIAENPILINPEREEPRPHFRFLQLGIMRGTSEKGNGTIDICKLNRIPLVKERQKVINGLLKQLKVYLLGFHKNRLDERGLGFVLKAYFDKIKEEAIPENAYTLWRKTIWENIDLHLFRRLRNDQHKAIARRFFEAYQNGNLS